MSLSEEQWRDKLSAEQYRMLRGKDTEIPFSGRLLNERRSGVFRCAACGAVLFNSEQKFESGSGWPSFYEMARTDAVNLNDDYSHNMHRVEATCANCGSHLGHVFDDGPEDKTGKRYCINSVCLAFDPMDLNKK